MLALVTLYPDAYGYLSDDMAKTFQLCCDEGHNFAQRHTERACQGNLPATTDISPFLESMCTMAKKQCCTEYFQKKNDCDAGVDISVSSNSCDSIQGTSKECCEDCSRGTSLGAFKGPKACLKSSDSFGAEEMKRDAFMKCCLKASKDWEEKKAAHNSNSVSLSMLPSTCEDYAPNELCAHHCIPVPGSYRCECNPGFMLMTDGRNCKQVTKNRCKPRNHCQHKCNDNGVEVKCSCRRGYELMRDGKSCQDIDECQLDVSICLTGTKCHNIQGSYKCIPDKTNNTVEKGQCPPGYARNAISNVCDDINECELPNPPCPAYKCQNTVGGYVCGGSEPHSNGLEPAEERCPPGFQVGKNEECEDVDECLTRAHDCNILSQFCINTHSSFYCQDKVSKHCPPGFKPNVDTNKCEDINECEEDSDVCRLDQICINQLGQYDCKQKIEPTSDTACPEGLRKKEGSDFCEDIDECAANTHICSLHQSCLNTHGSYDCHCVPGYELDITTGACVDVNECATGQHECMPQAQRCDNTVGSYLCVRITPCGTGYVLQHSTGECEDIDECALGTHNCGRDYSCYNLRGSFRCVRRRPATTTTEAPDYEYYYDSEEEIDNPTGNTVNASPKESSTTTTSTTTTSTTTTTTTPKPEPSTQQTLETSSSVGPDKKIEDNNIEPPSSTDIHYSEPKYTDKSNPSYTIVIPKPPELPPKPEVPQPQPIPTEVPKPIEPEPTPTQPELTHIDQNPNQQPRVTEDQLFTTDQYSVFTEAQSKEPETKPTEWLPYQPPPPQRPSESNPIIPPEIPEDELPKEPEIQRTYAYETSSSIDISPQEPERQPEITYTDITPSTERTSSIPSFAVNVNVGEGQDPNEITIGSVEHNQDVPKNEWPKVNIKPKDCPIGFEPDEYGSCFDIDECATNRHSCSGLTEVCRNTIGGYTCSCAPGFRRHWITKACDLITTSSSTTSTTTPPPTLPTSTSRSLFWGYPEYRVTIRPFRPRNLCDAGYLYNTKTFKCEDINECTNGQANCASVEICVNTEGGYKCECPPNWRLDKFRHRCVPNYHFGHHIPPGYGNEPDSILPPQVDIPISTGTKYVEPEITQIEDRGSVFKCPTGYVLGDDKICIDINECLTGEAKCGPLQTCSNLPGGYSCNCRSGYKLIGDHECEDVNECTVAGNLPVCSQNADCVNTMGSYQCKCHKGFRSAPINDKVCVDLDECSASRSGTLCQHRCNNVWGGYRCSCHRGYRLNIDNTTCSDIDECKEFKSKLPCVGPCLNEPGSYRCSCPNGYKLSEDGRSCIDIDECETGEAPCSKSTFSFRSNDVCVNTRGGFKCHHISCPIGYKLENKHRCTKVERICQPGDWNCSHQPTTISYNFITFVSNLYIPETKLKLFTMKGPAWANAKMRFELRLLNVNAPPSVKKKADINDFLLSQENNFEGLMSLVRPLEGPQSIELEMSMEVYTVEQFGGTAVAKLFIFVSEYEF